MTDNREVMLQNYTRREFREGLEAGQFAAAIIPTGSIEQHLEHLPFDHDIASSTWVARQVALRLYPKVIVAVPMAVGLSEHHMKHKGSLTAKPGSWLAVLFDAVECFARHGIENILILNGHGGNVQPVNNILRQWRLFFESTAPGVNLHFHPYWNLIPRALTDEHMVTKSAPGHAQEFETSLAMHMFPEKIRHDAMQDQEDKTPLEADAEKGRILSEEAVNRVVEYLEAMMEGKTLLDVGERY